MPRNGWIALALAFGLGVSWGLSPPARADKLRIDRVKGEDFPEKGTIRIYADILGDDNAPVDKVDAKRLKVFIDDKEVDGSKLVETFQEAREFVAVGLLIPAHDNYLPLVVPEEEEGAKDPAEEGEEPAEPDAGDGGKSPFELGRLGFKQFAQKLAGNDFVGVWMITRDELKRIYDWGTDHKQAANSIETHAKPETKRDSLEFPRLYSRMILEAVKKFSETETDLPVRRILVVLSDGMNRTMKQKKIDDAIEEIAREAADADVKIYALGYNEDTKEGFTYLQSVANKTGGIFREISVDDLEKLPVLVARVADELKKQYVITFKPHEDYGGAEEAVKLRLQYKTDSGRPVEDNAEGVKVGVKPTNWGRYAMYAGIALGSLLGLFGLWKLIGWIRRRRANRPVEVEVDEEYVGPYKGKLLGTGGPAAGIEFFLVDDVTTIGSIEGNGIVLMAQGVSKRHAGIKIEEMRFELADFGSTNGTFVNGTRITKQFLRDGDIVGIGDCEMKFALK